jgi:hypothetical protein
MKKETPKIKLSKKNKERILMSVRSAFNTVTGTHPCYDYPPETWMEHERDLWDALQKLESHTLRNLEEIIKT